MAHLDRPYEDWVRSVGSVPAQAMGLEGHGTLCSGSSADFVVFRGRCYSELMSRPQVRDEGARDWIQCAGGAVGWVGGWNVRVSSTACRARPRLIPLIPYTLSNHLFAAARPPGGQSRPADRRAASAVRAPGRPQRPT